jgi:hypothetical protein
MISSFNILSSDIMKNVLNLKNFYFKQNYVADFLEFLF